MGTLFAVSAVDFGAEFRGNLLQMVVDAGPMVQFVLVLLLVFSIVSWAINMVTGVTTGYTRKLELVGVGYRAEMKGSRLQLQLGFSHPNLFVPPAGIKVEAPTQTNISISGIDRQLVGQVAAKIRSFRPPEPYKGKGVKYEGEVVRRKAGKAAAAAGAK